MSGLMIDLAPQRGCFRLFLKSYGSTMVVPEGGDQERSCPPVPVLEATRVGTPEHIIRCTVVDAMPRIRFPLRETPPDQSRLLTGVTTLRLHPGIDFICDNAFAKLLHLTHIENMSELKLLRTIPRCAFFASSSLTSIDLSGCAMLSCIGNNAFWGCGALESVHLPDSLTEIGPAAFGKCYSLRNIAIPTGVTEIHHSTFACCSSLERIQIPASASSIGRHAFYKCASLKSLTFAPEGECTLKYLGKEFILGCKELEMFVLPSSVVSMESGAFTGFSNRIQLPWEQYEDLPGDSDRADYPVLTMAFVLLQRAGKKCGIPICHESHNDDHTPTVDDLTNLLMAVMASPMASPMDWVFTLVMEASRDPVDQELVLTQAIFLIVLKFQEVLFISRDGNEPDRSKCHQHQ
jgi:BspA type Leucine rich repeat region (6 copies)